MITVQIAGLKDLQRGFSSLQDQIPFATARAITVTAHQVNAGIKDAMRARITGGPTAYTLGAFRVLAATKASPVAEVTLKDGPAGGTPYERALGHLFRGGQRDFKRLETAMRSRGLIPSGLQIAPAHGLPTDSRGNIRLAAIKEMLGVITSPLRNLRVYGRDRKKKPATAYGFFVIFPGASKHLAPGVYRRIENGNTSVPEPWLRFVAPAPYRQIFDLDQIATRVVSQNFAANFRDSMERALASAKP